MIAATRTSPSTTQPKWVHNTTEEYTQIIQQPKDGVAIIATGSPQGLTYLSNLEAIDARTGDVKWHVDNAFYSNQPPTVGADGNLWAVSNDGKSLETRDIKTGKVIRDMPEDLALYSPCSQGKNVYAGAATSSVQGIFAFDSTTGAEKWRFPMHYLTGIAPVEVGGSVFCENGEDLYALDPDTGKLKWDFQCENGVTRPPVVGPNGLIYVVDAKSTVYAIDPNAKPTGTSMAATWTNRLDVAIPNPDHVNSLDSSQPLSFSKDGITAVTTGVTVRQLDADSGAQKWEKKFATEDTAVQGPSGTVYVGGQDNGILAVNPTDGSSAWWDANNVPATSGGQTPVSVIAPYGVGKLAGWE